MTGGGRPPLLLLIADDETTADLWRLESEAGPVLVAAPELVRTAEASGVAGSQLDLTGDTVADTELRVWAPPQVTELTWNGQAVATEREPAGALAAVDPLPGPESIELPDLAAATWRTAPGSPEADPGFDDSTWALADTATLGDAALGADQHGFHQGDVWYRGHLAAGGLDSVTFEYGGGGAGLLQAWVDGVYLGQDVIPSGEPTPQTVSSVTFQVPPGIEAGEHVLSVMVRNNGHNQDIPADDMFKEPRGLISADVAGTLVSEVAWRVQGSAGGEDILDPVRGVMNAGGGYGERLGWHLPGFPDDDWAAGPVPATGDAEPGTTWYRTTVDLDLPADHDVSLGLTIGDTGAAAGEGRYRALVFVNGWNLGQYIADVGPQHTFVLPNGILDPSGENTLAIAVTSDGGAGNGLEVVSLTTLGVSRGGVPVTLEPAPAWSAEVYGPSLRREVLACVGEIPACGPVTQAGRASPGRASRATASIRASWETRTASGPRRSQVARWIASSVRMCGSIAAAPRRTPSLRRSEVTRSTTSETHATGRFSRRSVRMSSISSNTEE